MKGVCSNCGEKTAGSATCAACRRAAKKYAARHATPAPRKRKHGRNRR